MKILVTGAAGFIGSYLSRALIWRGDDVVGIDNFYPYYPRECKEFNLDLVALSAKNEVKHNKHEEVAKVYDKLLSWTDKKVQDDRGSFTFYEGDIRNYEFLESVFSVNKFDAIMHLAAMGGVPYSLKNPRIYSEVNVDGTVNLLDLAAKNSIANFVLASSSSVYGNRKDVPFKETDNVNIPISTYAATKVADEVIGYSFHHNHKMPVTCLRFFTVYGPLQRPYGMVIQRFIQQAHRGIPLSVFGDGSMGRDYTYVEDIVSGIMASLDNKLGYEILNLGNSSPATLNELIDHLKKAFGREIKVENQDRPSTEVDITYADVSKAKKLLGYDPKTSLSEGVSKQVEIFNTMPEWYRNLEMF